MVYYMSFYKEKVNSLEIDWGDYTKSSDISDWDLSGQLAQGGLFNLLPFEHDISNWNRQFYLLNVEGTKIYAYNSSCNLVDIFDSDEDYESYRTIILEIVNGQYDKITEDEFILETIK